MGEIAINPLHNVHKKYRQMNLVNPYTFTLPVDLSTNTYIGGVSASISTASALATKLGISVGNISNFTVVGSDIKCKITGSYTIPDGSFTNNLSITFYESDTCSSFYSGGFAGAENLNRISLKNANSILIGGASFIRNYQLSKIYLPNCTAYGTTVLNNDIFFYGAGSSFRGGCIIYANPSMSTINSGGVEGDLAYAITQGATVRYVTNFTAPNSITTLSAGTIYNIAIQLNFTAPSSTNAIDFYECYANGVFKNTITASGGYITGLTASTSYNITVVAVDVFMNKSVVSNTITQSTNTTSYLEFRTVAAYDLATNGNDAKGTYNGTVGAGTTFASSEATFNGTSTAYVSVTDADVFSFGNGTTDQPFSISFYMQFANKATAAGYLPISKSNNANNINDEYYLTIYSGIMYWRLMDDNTIGSHIGFQYNMSSLSNNTYYHFTFTYDGSKTYAGIRFYINGVLTNTTSFASGTYTGMNNGTHPFKIGNDNTNSFGLNGKMKNVYVFNSELIQTEVTYLQSNNYPF